VTGRIALLLAAMVTAILSLGTTFFAAETTVAAETTTSLTSTADTKLVENAPTTNYGLHNPARATGDDPAGSGKDVYSLLKWDLTGIAPGTKISSASVDLNVTNASNQTYQLYEIKRPWVEREASWQLYASGSSWELAGAKGTLDRGAQLGTITPKSTGKQSAPISASVVQRWIDEPTTNQGIIIANTTNTDAFDFSSREAATTSNRPQLSVTYTTSDATDTTPPESTIDSGPSGTVSSASAAFTFSSNEANSVFECRLDGVAFSACTSPKSYTNLSEGSHTFELRATDAAGNTDPTSAVRTWIVDTTSTQSDPVLVGAGDIASCASSGDEATAKLLDGISGTVFAAGDTVYEDGTAEEFANCYDPSWGRHKARTYPIPGNHEYHTANATGYFGYFGAAAGDPARGYYSYDLGQWHIVALNSVCAQVGGCEATSPMVTWLKQDLAANPRACTLAYVHHPLFSSGPHGNQTFMRPTWDALYAADADVVISGNDHDYERFAPQNPSGAADQARGIREFVVGTGGNSLYSFTTVRPNSEVRYSGGYGVLKLTLHPSSYDWQFVSEAGKSFADSGSGQCHGAPGETDTVAPTVSSVVPADGATDVEVTASAEATFSESMDPNTISTTTFTLTKQGASDALAAQVSYDAATKKAILHPSVDLEAGSTYTATLKGGAMGVKDLAGNPLGADKTWSFSTSAMPLPLPDITAPETTIDSGPSGTVSTSSTSFAFSSSEPNSTFECSLEGEPFASCSSPKSYINLSDGSHAFEVRATDAAGNTDATPASRTWTVDTTGPDTTIDSGPSETITVAEATFAFSSEAGAIFECRLNGTAYSACTSPKNYTNLTNGSHTFEVRAKDGAGNVDATPASRTFIVDVPPPPQDTTPPETTIDSGPSGTIKQNSASFSFSSSEAGSTFQCKLDSAAFSACVSPKKYTGLAQGSHTFSVRATDAAGNTDASPASRTWTVRR
jgi:hypothetical protein